MTGPAKYSRWRKVPREKVRELRADGLSTSQIARRLGCDSDAVSYVINELGLLRSHHGPEPVSSFPTGRSVEQLAYLAGIIDGEGTVTLVPSRGSIGSRQPTLFVTNTDWGLIEWLTENFGGRVQSSQPKNLRYKIKHRWILRGYLSVRDAILALRPYLVIKRKRAEEVLTYCNWQVAERRRRADERAVKADEEDE